MATPQLSAALVALILPITILTIGIPLHQGPRCMIIQGEFDVHRHLWIANKVVGKVPQNPQQIQRREVQTRTL